MEIGKRLAKLLDVKSIVTLVLTGVFSWLALDKTINGDQFLSIFTVVVAFYFGTQTARRKEEADGAETHHAQ